MKSAYELAMERLEKQSPAAKVSAEMKTQLAEIDSVYRAKIAEREVFLKDQIAKAQASGKFEEVAELADELSRDVKRLQNDCESKKEKVRQTGTEA